MDRYELYYNYAHSQIQEQDNRKQSIEVKARGFITLSIALLGVAVLIAANFTSEIVTIGGFSSLPLVLTLISFIWAVGASFRILSVDEWYISPPLERLQAHVQNPGYSDEYLVEWTADRMVQAYILNEDILMDKSGKLRWALIALSIQGAALGLLILTIVWT